MIRKPIYASSESDTPKELPQPGIKQAVCAFVEDMGMVYSEMYGKVQHKVIIFWELADTMADGRRFMLSKNYTLSLGDKANLRKDLQSWRGKPFTKAELKKFDISVLVGQNCGLNVIHYENKRGNLRAKVDTVLPMMAGWQKMTPENTEPPKWVESERYQNSSNYEAHQRGQAVGGKPPKDPKWVRGEDDAPPPESREDESGDIEEPPF